MDSLPEYERAKALLKEGQYLKALSLAEKAHNEAPNNPQYKSIFGLLHGLQRGLWQESLGLCWDAVAADPQSADLYYNLAQVYLRTGQKDDAISTLQSGLDQQPEHQPIRALLGSMGIRREPLFSSLPRGHFLNRYVGLIAARLGMRDDAPLVHTDEEDTI